MFDRRATEALSYGRVCLAFVLFVNLTAQSQLAAGGIGSHVVGLGDLRAELSARSVQRTHDLEEIRRLFSHELVHRSVGNLIDMDKVILTLPSLEDETLHQLAVNSKDLNNQLRAGFSPVWIVLIVAGVMVLIAILVTCTGGGESGPSSGG